MITLRTERKSSGPIDKNNLPKGLELVKDAEYLPDYERHEYAPARYYNDMLDRVVADINGNRYCIMIEIHGESALYGHPVPHSATVSFLETDAPETEYEEWDEAEALVKMRARAVEDLKEYRDLCIKEPEGQWESFVQWRKREIADIDAGELGLKPPFEMQLFGQPQFIQGEIFPVHDGVLAYHLATLNTEWGDLGNVNILFSCDKSGKPCKVWFEASCH
jgi:hypothetical protein